MFTGVTNFASFVNVIIDFINYLVPVIMAMAVFAFMFGIQKYIYAGGSEEKLKGGREMMIYGVIGMVVIISVWGLVNVVATSVFDF